MSVPMAAPLSNHWNVKLPLPPVAVAVQVTVQSALTGPQDALTELASPLPGVTVTEGEVTFCVDPFVGVGGVDVGGVGSVETCLTEKRGAAESPLTF